MTPKTNRIEQVDALRGFAIVAIVLLHNMEHFEFYFTPKHFSAWLIAFNQSLMDTSYLLFGGKAYAIFALLFGFSFYIQHHHQAQKGNDYSLRFVWRMALLLVFGIINTAFYQGDILTLYAVLGLVLVPASYFSTKIVLPIGIILLLQPTEWYKVVYAATHPGFVPAPNASVAYYGQISNYMNNGGFWEYVVGNLTLGKAASLLWSWENGRFLQAPALFLFGLVLGRKQLFVSNDKNLAFWKKTLLYAAVLFLPLYATAQHLPQWVAQKSVAAPLLIIFNSWANFALMLVWVSAFICLFAMRRPHKLLQHLVPFGKMGLTNYILQSVVGSTLYYKYGLGLYATTGVLHCLCIGIVLVFINILLCKWWLKTHSQGPLEYVWHRLMWLGAKDK
jgi:uncharacterized protein